MADLRTDLRRTPDRSECLTVEAFIPELRDRIDRLMERPSKPLNMSPRAAFDADPMPLVRVDPRIVALALLHGRTKLHKIGPGGIEFAGNHYVAAELAHFHGHRVTIGWKGRAEDRPPEIAVFLASAEALRIKRQLVADRAVRRGHDRAASTDEEIAARRPSGPLIDDGGGDLVDDFLCIAVRSDLAGPDLIARITANRERYVVTVRDAERGGQERRLRMLRPPLKPADEAAPSPRVNAAADRAARRRAAADRERARGAG